MCTARPPFRADTSFGVLRRITDTEPRPIREINPDIPAWLSVLVDKLLAKRPSERFASAAEAAATLEQCLAHVQQPGAVALPDVCRVRPLRDRRFAWLIGAAASLLLIALIANNFGMFTGPQPDPNRVDSQRDAQPFSNADDSPSTRNWNAITEDIQSLSNDASLLEEKTNQLWNRQLSPFPNESD
jgi:hypothetical protein